MCLTPLSLELQLLPRRRSIWRMIFGRRSSFDSGRRRIIDWNGSQLYMGYLSNHLGNSLAWKQAIWDSTGGSQGCSTQRSMQMRIDDRKWSRLSWEFGRSEGSLIENHRFFNPLVLCRYSVCPRKHVQMQCRQMCITPPSRSTAWHSLFRCCCCRAIKKVIADNKF